MQVQQVGRIDDFFNCSIEASTLSIANKTVGRLAQLKLVGKYLRPSGYATVCCLHASHVGAEDVVR